MSNDATFDLLFVCPTRELLESVIKYLERKYARWISWKNRGKQLSELLDRVGANNEAAGYSLGFSFGEIQVDEDGEASVRATVSGRKTDILGDDSELADLKEKFAFLEISGTYVGEYSSGEV